MGQEIPRSHFAAADFERFGERLRAETELLARLAADRRFTERGGIGGLELEAWLVRTDGRPADLNEPFLERVALPTVVPELSRFNFEINVAPQALAGEGLARLGAELSATLGHCRTTARALDAEVIAIGILPTVAEADLVPAHMSRLKRYRALNRQVLRQREGQPLKLDIVGREHLSTVHHNVMLEAATTSLQAHLQVPASRAARYYNASVLASAPLVATTANSPLLFGKLLWEETRIPLFEQSVAVGGFDAARGGPVRRVTFGSRYVQDSLTELFRENLDHYPALLPMTDDAAPPEALAHLRLHNGTVWRWNRPLVERDEDGGYHFRVEQRVMPAGPTAVDMLANLAFFFGLCEGLAWTDPPLENDVAFPQARDNFYQAARLGLSAHLVWRNGARCTAGALIRDELLPLAQFGLAQLGVQRALAADLLAIVGARTRSGRTGAAWQRDYYERHGRDAAALTRAYLERQVKGRPVHEWTA
ncbi:MAG: glutamate--cysteine ligase [Pseudomonadota bacterium]